MTPEARFPLIPGARSEGSSPLGAGATTPRVRLTRYCAREDGTFGWLVAGSFSCFTLERPWRDNQPLISCIPAGTYRLSLQYSPRFARSLWSVENVPSRSGIRIHPANRSEQLEGCIALGESISADALGWYLTRSRDTVQRFHAAMGTATEAEITIVNAPTP